MPGTDNSRLEIKVRLRVDHLPAGPVRVLDAFGGYGSTWAAVRKETGRSDMKRCAIDQEVRPGAVHGDNRKWLAGVDLERFNVIDLDAYGIPFDQMAILFLRRFRGVVFFTFIQSGLRCLPRKLYEANGIAWSAVKQCPTLFGRIGWQLWCDYLASHGVRKLWVYHCDDKRSDKHYGCFSL